MRPGDRVRVKPDTEEERYALKHGLSTRGTVVNFRPAYPDKALVEWDRNHPGERRPKHREIIDVSVIEPL